MTTLNEIFSTENLEKAMSSFDFNSLFNNENSNVIKKSNNKTELKGSSYAIQISKLSKAADERYNRKVKSSYASNYEKAIITIFEKHNGEI